MKKYSFTALAFVCGYLLPLQATDYMKAFPPADEGMSRHVLKLPEQKDESNFKVELIVGKTVVTDAVNRYFFASKIEAKTISGWGFTRYEVKQLGPMAGTLMGVLNPNQQNVSRFVALGGEPYLIAYNSKLPVVVYVPEDAEVRYRIWTAEPETMAMAED
ncbi:MAG: ecotin [Opitutales bacterium]